MNNTTPYRLHGIARQRGVMALLISLIILTLITFVSLYTAKTVSLEQKISAAELRSRAAFEAAEAGMDAAMIYISPSSGGAERDAPADGLGDELIFESNGEVVIGSPNGDEQNWKVFTNNSRVIVSLAGTASDVEITALGISGDGAAQRKIKKNAAVINPLPNFPNVPFSAKGAVTVQGSATVTNPEGNSTIRTGGVFGWTSSGAQTNIPDPAHANYPECLGGSNSCADAAYAGLTGCPTTNYVKCDVIEVSNNDVLNIDIDQNFLGYKNATGEEFFKNMFGLSKSAYKAKRVNRFVDPAHFQNAWDAANDGVDGATGEVIWVTGDVTAAGGAMAGCAGGVNPNSKTNAFDENCQAAGGVLDPVIIIVDGDMAFTQSPQFFGMVYVVGNITSNGNTEIQGALAQEQTNATVDVTGSLDIWYDSAILEGTGTNGPFSGSSGTWQDF